MPIVGIGTHAPAVFAGEFAAAQPAASPTVPTQIQVPTPTMDVRAEDLQILAQGAIDGLDALANHTMTIAGNKTFSGTTTFSGDVHVAQTKSIIADGTGANLAGEWTHTGDLFLGNSASSLAITNATNASPIVVTVASHGLVTGEQVTNAGVGGNTAANGTWVVNVLTSSTFELVGSSGNGAYTSGGTMSRNTQVSFSGSRTVTRVATSFWNDGAGNGTGGARSWYCDNQGRFFTLNASPTTNPQYFGFEIDAPQGAVLNSVSVMFTPPTGHGAVPVSVPQVNVYSLDLRTGAPSGALGSANDPNTGSAGAYEVFTTVTATLTAIVDRQKYRYYAVFVTETGTNALQGTKVLGAEYSFSVPAIEQY